MKLSIIIVNFNLRQLLLECLDSIEQTVRNIEHEIILVDNASVDDSLPEVREKFPRVKILANQSNLGFAAANNQAAVRAAGEYLFLLNNDTRLKPGAVQNLLDFADSHPDAGLLGAKLLNPDGSPQKQGGESLAPFWRRKHPVRVGFLPAAAAMIKKELYEKLGGFDEKFYFYNEDLDLCRRILKAGYRIYFVPAAEVIHYGGQSAKKLGSRALVAGFLGGLRYCRKHYPRPIFYIYRGLIGFLVRLYLLFPGENKDAWLEILKKYKTDDRIYQP